MVYIVGPPTPSKIVLWKYYFPIKVLPLFLAIIWGNIHNDVREMLTYMRKDEEKTQRLKKRFLIKKQPDLFNRKFSSYIHNAVRYIIFQE